MLESGKILNMKIVGNLSSDTSYLLMKAALNGNGIFIAPMYMVSRVLSEGLLKTALDDYTPTTTGLYSIYLYSKLVSKKVRVFVDFLVET